MVGAAWLGVLCCAAACSAPPGAPAAGGPADPGPKASPVVQVLSEVWSLLDGAEAAKGKAVTRCMEGRGFTVHPASPAKAATRPAADAYPYRDGAPTLEQAQRNGYGLQRQPSGETPSPAQAQASAYDRLPQADRDRYQAALGTWAQYTLADGSKLRMRRGGCDEEVMTSMYGDLQRYFRLVAVAGDMSSRLRSAGEADERVVAATKRWTSCMVAAGYPGLESVDDAEAAAVSYHWPHNAPAPSFEDAKRNEIALAVADAKCSETSQVDRVLRSAWTEHAQQYMREHDTEFVALRELLQAAVVAAQRLLGA
ncbi:hypothetical protein ACPPVO_05500 [Dactylosporangium sp. McL0621]|uniref:hypothetical protein n=1 Tax=Dactylosporangium sp. McL0621 TaxID=3415678 RepID=UPI003CEBEF37